MQVSCPCILALPDKHFGMRTERFRFLTEGFHTVNGRKHEVYSANPNDKMLLGMEADRKNPASTVNSKFSMQGKVCC
jgi:hypothetical protein